jgi:hypothetical protein
VLLHNWNTATLLVKNDPFSREEILVLRNFATERQFDLAWFAGMRGDEANRYNRMPKPTLFDAAVALLGTDRSAFIADYKFDIRPVTDDRPFFFVSGGVFCRSSRQCTGKSGSCLSMPGTSSSFWRCSGRRRGCRPHLLPLAWLARR